MNHKNQLILPSALVFCLVFSLSNLYAEGTAQLSPTPADSAMLHTNASGFGNFASFTSLGTTSALNVEIKDFTTEKLYIGLSAEADDFGNLNSSYTFRIVDSVGNVVHGPFTIGTLNDNADTWLEAASGPDILNASGYSTNTSLFPYSVFMPAYNGTFTLQFDDGAPNNIANILFYDFTVVANMTTVMPGRLWSRNWAIRTPPINPNQLPECQFDRPFNGVFYSYTMDGFVSRIEFDSSGFQGLSFTVSFGDRGPGNTGDVIEDRRSVNDANATANNADHMVFLSEPDTMLFPSNIDQCGSVALISVSCEAIDSFCINVGVTQPGQVEVILDFNNNGIYDFDTTDVLIAMILPDPDTICLPWDGLKGDGTPIEFGEEVPTVIRYSQGVQHYAAFDVEFLKNGFCVQTVRPICAGIATDLLYWDDSEITDDVVTVTIDEGDPGTGQPKVQLNGCECQQDSCRTWTTFQIGDPPSMNCTGTPFGYGENATLNTWWYASTIIIDDISLPFAQVQITGDSVICEGTTTEFFADVFPDTIMFSYAWTGPGGFMANTPSTGPIGTAGTYYVTITDTITNCSAIDSALLIVNENPTTSIIFTCEGPNQQNANIDLTVSGGAPPYSYLWSTGEMTEDLFDVPPGEYFVTVTDANGCQAVDSITVEGCCELIVNCPPEDGGTYACVEDVPSIDSSGIVVVEYCDTFFIDAIETTNGGEGCPGDTLFITRTYTVQDSAGNSQTCVVNITVLDTIATITCPADVTVECANLVPAPNPGALEVPDNCGGNTTVLWLGDNITNLTCANRFTITRTYLAVDDCGNTASCNQIITVFDDTPPMITCPANITVECATDVPAPNTISIVASDNCGGVVDVTVEPDVISNQICPNQFTITRVYVATDECGNSGTCAQTITVFDDTPPTITCPADITVECASDVPAPDPGALPTSDNCGGTPIVTVAPDIISNQICDNQFTITRIYTATDDCGNTATCAQIITVFDDTPPLITCPADITVECTIGVPAPDPGSVTTSDNCGGVVTVTAAPDVITNQVCENSYTITRIYTASDDCGNSATCAQTIVVIDITAPVITCPVDITVECANEVPAPDTTTVLASDNCGGGTTLDHISDVTINQTCTDRFDIVRTYLATDACGNTASCIQTISVFDDTPPVITCPADVTVQCADEVPPSNVEDVTATDNCGGTPEITVGQDIITNLTCLNRFTVTRIYTATDDCGNSATCAQTITVFDDTAPVLTCPADVTVECATDVPVADIGLIQVTDNCDGSFVVTVAPDVVSNQTCPNQFTITRIYSATDECGNTGTCAQIITVFDDTPPTITCPPDVTVECGTDVPPGNPGGVVTSDNCGGVVTVTFTDDTQNMTCADRLTVVRTYTATDECGNSATCTQNLTVFDDTPPVITCPPGVTVSCASEVPAVNTGSVVATDNCGGTPTVTHTGDIISNQTCPNQFTLTRTYQATDLCGNTSSCSQVIIVNDQTPPTAICQDIEVSFDEETTVTITPEDIDNGSFDNCGGTLTYELSQSEFDCEDFIGQSTIPVTLTVTDECGNSSTCVALVTGLGGVLEIDCPADIVVFLGPGECSAFVNYVVTADAICGGSVVTIEQIDTSGLTSGDAFPIGTTIQTYRAFNNADTAECSFTITVVEFDGPVVMACNDTVNVSVDANCEAHIFADMILEGDQYGCYDDFIITVEGFGTDTGWIVVTGVPVNECYTITITDPETGNSCWGVACIEDKLPPQIVCACPVGGGGDSCVISCLEVDQLVQGNIPPNLQPDVIENCSFFEVDIEDIVVDDEGCGGGNVIITWIVTDGSGLTATCVQEFEIEPLSIDSIVFPPNYVGECGTSSDPDVTGWPQVNGIDLTDEAGLCNLFLGYWDKALLDCGGGVKILRTWTVLDWCTLELVEVAQIIKLSDTEGPILTCPDDLTVGTDFWYCFANVSVPKPIASDDCSDVVSFDLSVSEGFIVQFGNNFVVNQLPIGDHTAIWTVTDLCGNSSTCSFTITVEDDVVPVANCDEHTIVSLTTDGPFGLTLVPATVFDDGSYDNCSPVTFRARRMDSCIDFDWTTEGACIDHIPGGIPPVNSRDRGTVHRPCVPFACCDVGAGPIMVELEVTDASGNVNYCMVEVEVQDKISPFVECPPDITVSCDFWFAVEEGTFEDIEGNANGNLDEDPLSAVFGNMFDAFQYNDDESVRQDIIINDPGALPDISPQPHFWGIDGWADDNCEVNLQVRVRVIDDCSGDDLPANAPPGAVRLIERRFSASDGSEGIAPGTCTQRIWVVDFDPFFITDVTCNNANPNDGVIWPCDVLLTTCPEDLGDTGEPVIFDDACSLIGVAFEDTRFNFVDGVCFKILRRWSVIDWCQYDPVTGAGLWHYTQVIKVNDHEGPEFLECPQGPVTLCVADPGVTLPDNNQAFLGEDDPLSSSCSAHLNLCQPVFDACSGFVRYDVKIYLFNSNEFIQVKPTTSAPVDTNNIAQLCFDTRQSTIQSIRLNGIPYNSPWCGDYHRILWSAEDDCGNLSFCEYLFRLEDCKQPSPVCINGISTVLMPVGCEVTLWAIDFDASSFDDCTPAEELLFSFSGDSYQPSMTFNSDNIPAFGIELPIAIWVADGGTDDNCDGVISWSERNKDFCITTVIFTDNSGNCGGSGSILYEGHILTDFEQAVKDVEVSLKTDDETVYAMTTIENGKYLLVVPPVDGQRYQIVPKRNDNHRNGVSTLDLVRIQKHLLGKEYFDSPYQYIAADANNSQQVSAIDLVEIRKLILGIYTEFPNNNSWRFVDKAAGIIDETHPWPFEETINIQFDGSSYNNLDFVGVKIGDVNNSVQANAQQIQSRDGRRVLFIDLEEGLVKSGDIANVVLTIPESLAGFQWTLETNGLEYIGVSSADFDIDNSHVGVLGDGIVTMSWHQEDFSKAMKKDAKLVLQFKATQEGRLSEMISLTGMITEAEAYSVFDEILDVRLDPDGSHEGASFALYQNEPNPWAGSTVIRFDLPDAGPVKITFFDQTGKRISTIERAFAAGAHSITVNEKDIDAHGIVYYRLDSGNYSATKKMIRIQ